MNDERTREYIGERKDGSVFTASSTSRRLVQPLARRRTGRQGVQVSFASTLEQARAANPTYIVTGTITDVLARHRTRARPACSAPSRPGLALSNKKGVLYSENLSSTPGAPVHPVRFRHRKPAVRDDSRPPAVFRPPEDPDGRDSDLIPEAPSIEDKGRGKPFPLPFPFPPLTTGAARHGRRDACSEPCKTLRRSFPRRPAHCGRRGRRAVRSEHSRMHRTGRRYFPHTASRASFFPLDDVLDALRPLLCAESSGKIRPDRHGSLDADARGLPAREITVRNRGAQPRAGLFRATDAPLFTSAAFAYTFVGARILLLRHHPAAGRTGCPSTAAPLSLNHDTHQSCLP